MKCGILMCLIAGSLISQAAMGADTGLELAKSKNCLACHSVNTKIVGPAYKDVASKYISQKGVEDKLVEKVLKGGSGVWGTIPMPANAQVNEAEAHVLVKWVLSQK